MVRSKSGAIRQCIGPRKKRLQDQLNIVKTQVRQPVPTQIEAREEEIIENETYIIQLTTAIEAVETSDKQWQTLIQTLPDDEYEDEEKLYGDNATGDDGFINLIDDGKQYLGLLRLRVSRLKIFTSAPSTPVHSAHDLNISSTSTKSESRKSAKLPKLTLPFFNGDPLAWNQFFSIFKTNIHDTDLDGAEKLVYLRGQLTDTALDTIEGLEISNDSYEVAISLLQKRFERIPEQIVSSLYSQLKRLPKCSGRVEDMRKTHDNCERIFRQLKIAGEDIDSNRSLTMDVWSKYPVHVVKEISHRKDIETYSKLGEVQAALKCHIDECDNLRDMLGDLEAFGSNSQAKVSSKDNKTSSIASRITTGTTSALTTMPETTKEKSTPKFPCCFCNNLHFNSECTDYPTRQSRVERLKAVKRCQRCLGNRHTTEACDADNKRVRCYYCQSTGEHISALCPKHFSTPSETTMTVSTASRLDKTTKGSASNKPDPTTSCALSVDEQSILPTAVAAVAAPHGGMQKRVKIVLDCGSHRSYITERLATQLDLSKTTSETLNIAVFGNSRTLSVPSSQVNIEVVLRNGKRTPVTVHTTPTITSCSLSLTHLPTNVSQLVESVKGSLADDMSIDGPPDLLLGSDYFWEFITGSRMRTEEGIYMIPSSLGLVLGGRFESEFPEKDYPTLLCLTERTNSIDIHTSLTAIAPPSRVQQSSPDIDEFWNLERIGITDDPTENDDEIALKAFNDSIYFKDGRYHVSWPWKTNNSQLPTNYQLALGRLRSLAKRLSSGDSKLPLEYNKVIQTQLDLGIIEQVPDDEVKQTTNLVHYLPHHPVVKMDRTTTKVRIVYDASAKSRKDDVSLNECLYRGPVILPDLCAILIRFRMFAVAISADIEKAFLQIALDPSQRDVTRFLWYRDPTKLDSNDIIIYRFIRVLFGAITSPFLLGGTVQHHLTQTNTPTAEQISKNLYVDNVFSGTATSDEGKVFYDTAKAIFRTASMNLREWSSNSSQLLDYIPAEDQGKKGSTKVLGLKWDTDTDTLQLNNKWTNLHTCRSKREVLEATASVYDPTGFFQPCTLQLKLFLREVWKHGGNWDNVLEEKLQAKWKVLHTEISPIFNVTIPRYVGQHVHCNIVVFTDASAEAYATAVYLRFLTHDSSQTWTSHLIYAKSRLSPKTTSKSPVSIPKLELLGLTIGAKAAEFVRKSLFENTETKIYILSDSMCALGWLRSVKPLPVFVANRVREIKRLTNTEFHHVNGNDNPADLCTRGVSGDYLKKSELWWFGPKWLKSETNTWPTTSGLEAFTDDELHQHEQKTTNTPIFHTLVVAEGDPVNNKTVSLPLGINPVKYSSFQRLIRVTGWCLKFIKRFVVDKIPPDSDVKQLLEPLLDDTSNENFVTASERYQAKLLWLRYLQRENFQDVFIAIRTKKTHPLIKQLDLHIDNDIELLRSYGRLTHAELPDEAIKPILLPYDHHITQLIIYDIHSKLFHSGVNHTLSQTRREFWVPRGRNAVKKVLRKCSLCLKYKGPSFALPRMPPWPKERVSKSSPFQFTGVDYFGPVNVKIDNTHYKCWVALFTCLTVRAIHLEPVLDCTVEAFSNAISRFIARRGTPVQIISDNAPQFRVMKTLLDRTWHNVFRDESLLSYISNKGIRWKFTTELAPWMGGVYERLVGLVKNTYKNVVGRKLLKYEEFTTLLTEVESIVNSRPITYVHNDAASGYPLRPVDFLTDLCSGTPDVDQNIKPEGGEASKNLLRHWKNKQRRLDLLWKQWQQDYLLSMRERGGTSHKGGRCEDRSTPNTDEVVVIKNSDAPRGNWKLGRILKLLPSADGLVRSAEILLPNKQIIRRPINHLYRLEIPTTVVTNELNDNNNNSEDEPFDGFTMEEVEEAERRVLTTTTMTCGEHPRISNKYYVQQISKGLTVTPMKLSFEMAH